MKATCPKNPDHKKFVTTAHVMQDWVVDENGEFLEEMNPCVEVTHFPSHENVWTCCADGCGALAVVKP